MTAKRYALVGSTGYIGRHIERFLRESRGCVPACYDMLPGDETTGYRQIDLTQRASLKKIDLDVDYLFLFSGLTGTHAGFDRYERYLQVNELGLMNLLDTVRRSPYRPRIVFPSTRLVYKGCDRALGEEDEKETKTIYAVNKLSCEHLLEAYMHSFDIPFTVFRICVPYGNLLDRDYSFGTVGFFVRKAQQGEEIALYGGGGIKRTFTHIFDLCRQMIEACDAPGSENRIFNIGGETFTLKEVAGKIAERFGVKVVSTPWPERDLRIESGPTYFDDTRIKTLLGGYTYRRMDDFINEI